MIDPSDIRSAQFIDTYFPIVDGVVQVVHNYASIMNRDAYTCVVTPKTLKDFDDSSLSYDVLRTAALKLKVAEYALPVPKLDRVLKEKLREKRIDIFHTHSPFTEASFAQSYAKELSVPCVATFHSKYYDDVVNITGSKALAKIVTDHIVRFYSKVDSVWSVSQGAAETLYSYGYKGCITIMENGTTYDVPQNPDLIRERARIVYKIPTDKHILLFVGHQIWHKNLKLVLDTFKLLSEHSDDYRLLIVGDGYDEKEIRDYAKTLKFRKDTVRFLGRINDRELLMGVYLSSQLLFFPSVYDTSGLVVREAASLGVPSLLTECSNAAEAVERDISGFTAGENKVAMFREILRIFNTDGLIESVSAGARRDVARTWSEIVPQVKEKYAEIIERYNFKHKK